MDDTQQSRSSDVAAAATRKRRSSILKSQRPPRAPFSELEFNVATPTDTAKSRRVSFSRRTGVAEFVTNEATTTWKNFYEEHNKTLESSGNESEVKAPRQSSVGHLGRRIFEEQFQDCEVIDYASSTDIAKGQFNNVTVDSMIDDRKLPAPQQNFELSSLTATGSKLFEDNLGITRLEEFTDKVNVNFSVIQPIGDDLDEIQKDLERHANAPNVMYAGPNDRNLSGYIEVDLNATHGGLAINETASDDMSITDTIHSPKVNVSKSSISETKDQSLRKDWIVDKENIVVNPYITPKESNNFAINEDSDKVLVFDGKRLTVQSENEPISDYRKTLLPNALPEKTPKRKTIVLNTDDDLPNFVVNPHAHMSQLSQNISLDNSVPEQFDITMTQPVVGKFETNSGKKGTVFENIATRDSNDAAGKEKRRTIVFENNGADISVTQAVPANVVLNFTESQTQELGNNGNISHEDNVERRKTIVFDSDVADVSVTQAVPTNMIVNVADINTETIVDDDGEKMKTIVFDSDLADISMTQVVPSKMTLKDDDIKRKRQRNTIVFENDEADISVTQALPTNTIFNNEKKEIGTVKEKRNTTVFESDLENISVTQALLTNVILDEVNRYETDYNKYDNKTNFVEKEKRRTIVFETESADISMTQALPTNMIPNVASSPAKEPENKIIVTEDNTVEKEKRRTKVFETASADVSMTQVLLTNMIFNLATSSSGNHENDCKTIISDVNDVGKEKRRTIVFETDSADISMTQALPTNMIFNVAASSSGNHENECKTMISDVNDVGKEKRRTVVFETDSADISMTQAISTNVILNVAGSPTRKPEDKSNRVSYDNSFDNKRETTVFETNSEDISVTQTVPSNMILNVVELPARDSKIEKNIIIVDENVEGKENRQTVAETDSADVSLTQGIPNNMILNVPGSENRKNNISNDVARKKKRGTIVFESESADISVPGVLPASIIKDNNIKAKRERKTIAFESDGGNMSDTQPVTTNELLSDENTTDKGKIKTVFENDSVDISMTQAVPDNIILTVDGSPAQELPNKRKTILVEDVANVSITQTLPTNYVVTQNGETYSVKRRTIVYETDKGTISVTDMPLAETEPGKRQTFVFNESGRNISLTQSIPAKYFISELEQPVSEVLPENKIPELTSVAMSPKSINPELEDFDVSMTQALPLISSKDMESESNDDILNTSVEKSLILNNKTEKIGIYENTDVSKIESIPAVVIASNKGYLNNEPCFADVLVAKGTPIMDVYKTSLIQSPGVSPLHQDISQPIPPELQNQQKIILNTESEILETLTHEDSDVSKAKPDSAGVITPNPPLLGAELCSADTSITQGMPAKMVVRKTSPILSPGASPLHQNVSNPIPVPLRIQQKDRNILNMSKNMQFNAESTQLEFMVYQTAITGTHLGALKEDTLSVDASEMLTPSETSGNTSASNVIVCKETSMCTSQNLLSSSVQSADKTCSDSASLKATKSSVLESLLDMDDSFISYQQLEDRAVSAEQFPSSNSSQETVFRVTADKEDPIQISDEEEFFIRKTTPKCSKSETQEPQSENKNGDNFKVEKKENRCVENVVRRESNGLNETTDLLNLISQYTGKDEKVAMVRESIGNAARRRASWVAPKRQSIVLSREDIMNNISMAQAVLQECTSLDKDSTEEQLSGTDLAIDSDVVKTLRFEDDDETPENVCKDQVMVSPLKKTAFGETSYRAESNKKQNVIPSYLKDVSDGIKALMTDLVKPMPDELPFESPFAKKHDVSLRSREIQANLITSSQVDLGPDFCIKAADEGSTILFAKPPKGIMKKREDFEVSDSVHSTDLSAGPSEASVNTWGEEVETYKGPTLVFDPDNPLNNVLVKPIDIVEAHRYCPNINLYESCSQASTVDSQQKKSSCYEVRFNLTDNDNAAGETFEDAEDNFVSDNFNVHSVIPKYKTESMDVDLKENLELSPNDPNVTINSKIKEKTSSSNEANVTMNSKFKEKSSSSNEANVTMNSTFKENFTSSSNEANVTVNNKFKEKTSSSNEAKVTMNKKFKEKTSSSNEANVAMNSTFKENFTSSLHEADVTINSKYKEKKSSANEDNVTLNSTFKENLISTSNEANVIMNSKGILTTGDVKDQKVNTVIAMQENKILLQVSSSLTLVGSSPNIVKSEVEKDQPSPGRHSPTKEIMALSPEKRDPNKCSKTDYNRAVDAWIEKNFSDSNHPIIVNDIADDVRIPVPNLHNLPVARTSRRSYNKLMDSDEKFTSAHKTKDSPLSKKAKKDESPCRSSRKRRPSKKDLKDKEVKEKSSSSKKDGKKISKNSIESSKVIIGQKPKRSITVQQCSVVKASVTEPVQDLSRAGSESLFAESVKSGKSETSVSKGIAQSTLISVHNSVGTEQGVPVNWQPQPTSEASSKELVTKRDSAVDVVQAILDLPAVRASEVQWVHRGSDEWQFLVFNGRLRIVIALKSDGAQPSTVVVRPDTPVTGITVELTVTDPKKGAAGLCTTASVLCTRFAAETMRAFAAGCTTAGDVAPLLRRCGGVARVAARWGRAMQHAWVHLAYTVHEDGCLSLKVANLHLRTIWELTMRIELVCPSSVDVPYPRATDVRVCNVVGDARVHAAEIDAVLKEDIRDWGHTPRTLWSVFRYLKNKTDSENSNSICAH